MGPRSEPMTTASRGPKRLVYMYAILTSIVLVSLFFLSCKLIFKRCPAFGVLYRLLTRKVLHLQGISKRKGESFIYNTWLYVIHHVYMLESLKSGTTRFFFSYSSYLFYIATISSLKIQNRLKSLLLKFLYSKLKKPRYPN